MRAHRVDHVAIALLRFTLAAAASAACSAGPGRGTPSAPGAAPGSAPGGSPPDASTADGAAAADDVDDDLPLAPAPGLAPAPPMGWNSWNTYAGNISASLIEKVADAIVASGMKDAGYQYVNIDDGWTQPMRAADGSIQPTTGFPDGIAPVAAYVHGKGLKLGVYSDRGTSTCAFSGPPYTCTATNGSQGHDAMDAASYAAWGVDYLKYDNCCADATTMEAQYQAMGAALAATGRPIVYSVCAWSFFEWGVGLGNLWRTTGDITPTFDSFFANAMVTRSFAAYAGPNVYLGGAALGSTVPADHAYGWNDPDMLEVGNAGLTTVEDQTHFSLWAILAAPLIAGNSPISMTPAIQAILTNPEVIAIDQDALGLQGVPVISGSGGPSVWAKPLNESGARAVVLVNSGTSPMDIGFALADIGLRGGTARARDLVAHVDLGTFQDTYTAAAVPAHGSVTLKVSGVEPARPAGTAYLSDLRWTYAANGLGNAHKDESNSSSAAVTGTPLALRGTAYPKGLGVDGPSLVIYRLARRCATFTADVGVDDVVRGGGSVVFQVWVDGEKRFDSGVVTGLSPVQHVQVDVTGKRRLKLLVTNGGDGNALDRADWAGAQVVCDP